MEETLTAEWLRTINRIDDKYSAMKNILLTQIDDIPWVYTAIEESNKYVVVYNWI